MTIKIANAQINFTGDVTRNKEIIVSYIENAGKEKADIIQFPECTLTGYASREIESNDSVDWTEVDNSLIEIKDCAKQNQIYVVLGTGFKTEKLKPYNSLLLINKSGEIENRYDKRYCTRGDLEHYESGRQFITVNINGIRCGFLICYDFRFPELYREYVKRDVEIIFHSFHQIAPDTEIKHIALMREVGPAHLISRAAENRIYISACNPAPKESWEQWWSSRIVNPDGSLRKVSPLNTEHLLIDEIDIKNELAETNGQTNYFYFKKDVRRIIAGVLYTEL